MRGSVADGLRMSVGTLTALPVRPPSRVDRDVARAAMLAAPLPGILLGVTAAGLVALGAALDAPQLLVGVAVVGAVALASRGFHLDGLADTVDGLASSHDRDRVLAVMRSPEVGPLGAVALVLVLIAQVASLGELSDRGVHGAVAVGLAVLAGRSVLPVLCSVRWPAARAGGLGAAVAGTVPRSAAAAVAVAVLLICGLASWLGAGSAWQSVLAAVAGWAAALVLVARVVARIGGTTGDVLGAAVETATTVSLVVLATAG
jgi:adenosylcobinamide-GDP ribazoletransferase